MNIDQILRPCLHDCNAYSSADSVDNLNFRFLRSEAATCIAPGLIASAREIAALQIVELKGDLHEAQAFELLQADEGFWLVFQYLGKSMINNGTLHYLQSATYMGAVDRGDGIILQMDRGKTWLALVGIHGPMIPALKEEYAHIAHFLTTAPGSPPNPNAGAIGYRQKRVFEKIQQFQGGAYSLPVMLAHQVNELIRLFDTELGTLTDTAAHEEVALYYRALEYIKLHFLKPKVPRKEIAEHLCVHERTLTRAFEQKNVTISEIIQLVRLDRAREWIRQGEMPITEIAEKLYFENVTLFEEAYYALFKSSPVEDGGKPHARPLL